MTASSWGSGLWSSVARGWTEGVWHLGFCYLTFCTSEVRAACFWGMGLVAGDAEQLLGGVHTIEITSNVYMCNTSTRLPPDLLHHS